MVRTLRLAFACALVAVIPGTAASRTTQAPDRSTAGTTHRVVTVNFTYVPGDASLLQLPPQTIAAGDSLEHTNLDGEDHDLVSFERDPDGNPWFDSELVGPGETASVPVEAVPPGLYSFTCSIHPFMLGRLEIRDPSVPQPPRPVAEPMGEVEVDVRDNFFAPQAITVPVGTTVVWENTGNNDHSVTAADRSWDSSPACPQAKCMDPGETFTQTFNAPGEFQYYCLLHGTPSGAGHAGKVRVVEPGSIPTSVDSLAANATGTDVSVSGRATFGGDPRVTLAQDPAGDGPVQPGLASDAGVDLTGATVSRPDAGSPYLFFEWRVDDLPSSGSLPEAVRYTLPFRIGTERFQLQAKLSNAVSPTLADDPQGHATHPGRAFQLKGDCQDAPVPRCGHLAWLNGTFDTLNKVVRVTVPLGVTPAFAPGAVLERNESGPADLVRIRAMVQAGAPTDQTADDADWTAGVSYEIPEAAVDLGITPAGTPQSEVPFAPAGSLDADGSFGGSFAIPGPGDWDVWARACFGTNCGVALRRVTIV